MTFLKVTRSTLGIALILCASCGMNPFTGGESQEMSTAEAPPAAPRPAAKPKPKAPAATSVGQIELPSMPPPTPADLTPIEARGTLLQRLPKSSLLVLRLPHVEKLAQMLERTPFGTLMSDPRFGEASEQMTSGFARMETEIKKKFADYDELRAKLLDIEGELVFALVSVDASAFAKSQASASTFPVTFALMFDAGSHATDLERLMQRFIEEASKSNSERTEIDVVSASADNWHRRMRVDGVSFDLVREESQFMLQVGPAGMLPKSTPLARREVEDSFAAAHIVRATRDLARDGSLPVGEFFLNLDPIWTTVNMFAPPDAKSVLEACGATSIHGLSAAIGLGKSGIDEVLFVDSPGGRDLLTKVLTSRPLDPTLARWIPRDAQAAKLSTFDLQALFEGVRKLLPDRDKEEMAQSLDMMEQQGFDLRKDVIQNIGPTFAFTGDLDFMQALRANMGEKEMDLTVCAQVQDGARLNALLRRALGAGPMGDIVHEQMVEGFTTWSLDPVPLDSPDGGEPMVFEPSWYVGEKALIVSFSREGLARALLAGKNADNRGPEALKLALGLNAPNTFSVGTSASGGTGDNPGVSTTIGRRTSLGLEIVTRDGDGATSVFALGGAFGLAASVAIPKLMASRLTGNETAAVATLRNIHTAEIQFRQKRHDDLDHDGQGEFGTLGELTGAVTLRSGRPPLDPPLLSSAMRPDENDCFIRSGYVFRIDVAKRKVKDVNDDEREFIAYAWPVSQGMTGGKAYSIDADGRLLWSDNRGENQRYEGVEHQPSLDASKRSLTSHTLIGVKGRTGRDGGVWANVE